MVHKWQGNCVQEFDCEHLAQSSFTKSKELLKLVVSTALAQVALQMEQKKRESERGKNHTKICGKGTVQAQDKRDKENHRIIQFGKDS